MGGLILELEKSEQVNRAASMGRSIPIIFIDMLEKSEQVNEKEQQYEF